MPQPELFDPKRQPELPEPNPNQVAVIDSGLKSEQCDVFEDGAECVDQSSREQALIIYDDNNDVTVVQPNEDGSYWRKIVRNKMIRMKEKRRVQAAQAYVDEAFEEMEDTSVVSSWGPYTSISGTATKTGVAGLTAKSKLTEKEVDKASVRAQHTQAKPTARRGARAPPHTPPSLPPRAQTSPPGHLPPTFPAPPSTSSQGAALIEAMVRALLSFLLTHASQPHAPSHPNPIPIPSRPPLRRTGSR